MAGYTAWYGKKRKALDDREKELIAALEAGSSAAALAELADKIRAAQVRALRSKRAQLAPSERNAKAVANLDREIAYWVGLSREVIIDGYRTGKLVGHRSAASRRAVK